MPEINTRSDSLSAFLSGAASDGGSQTDPNASLGNFRSSTEEPSLGIQVVGGPSNITVDFAARENGVGAGSLASIDADNVAWTPPGGTQGASVTILNGESKLVEGGGSSGNNLYLLISRTSATDLAGTATITLTDIVNNVYGFDDIDSGEASAGDDEYRAFFLKNLNAVDVLNLRLYVGIIDGAVQQLSDTGQLPGSGAGTIVTTGSFASWPDTGWVHIRDNLGVTREIAYYESRTDTALTVAATGRGLLNTSADAGVSTDTVDAVPGIEIATEAPSGQPAGFIQTIADEDTAPTSLTFDTGITAADGIQHGTVAATNILGVWLHRQNPAATKAQPLHLNLIVLEYEAA